MLVSALFRLDWIPLDVRNCAFDGLAIEIGELNAIAGEDGHVAVSQKIDVARVVQDAGYVRRDKRLAFSDADHDWRPGPRGNDLIRFGSR